jgi:hypothetical protein
MKCGAVVAGMSTTPTVGGGGGLMALWPVETPPCTLPCLTAMQAAAAEAEAFLAEQGKAGVMGGGAAPPGGQGGLSHGSSCAASRLLWVEASFHRPHPTPPTPRPHHPTPTPTPPPPARPADRWTSSSFRGDTTAWLRRSELAGAGRAALARALDMLAALRAQLSEQG